MANELKIKNGLIVEGGAQVTGSLIAPNITGSLLGTASWAITASHAQSGNGTFSGSFSGSFSGDGSNLTGLTSAPAGNDSTIQFNDAGVTSGSGLFTYAKATSIVRLSGSIEITGSTVNFRGGAVTASIISASAGITGSLFGTASWAVSASQATNAVSALFATSASNLLSTASWATSASFLASTASWATSASHARTASFVATASWATNTLTASVVNSPQNYYTSASFSGSAVGVVLISTSSFVSTIINYTIISASNLRSGEIKGGWIPSTSNIVFYETTTTDIGDTNDVTCSLILSQSQAQVSINVLGSAGTWNFRGQVTNL